MAHTYTSCFIHAVFSTKRRQPILSPATRERLTTFIQSIAAKNGFRLVAAGGWDDHMHVLIKVPSILSIARALQLLKRRAATFLGKSFAWQEGYLAITVAPTDVDEAIAHIARQAEIHSAKTYEEETISFLKKNRIRYDLRYVFD
jgi:REP-associated tyrosine transposase